MASVPSPEWHHSESNTPAAASPPALRLVGAPPDGRPSRAGLTAQQAVSYLGAAAAVAILLWLFLLQAVAIRRCPYYGPASLVEESAYTYTSSQNYLRFGFLNSGLLQDFCNSPDPRDHPYVYDHMPAGPDILLALLLRATGQSYRAARLVLALGFLAGMWFYVRFCREILQRLRLPGAGFVVVLIPCWTLISEMDRLIYNLFPLLAFAPLVALSSFYRTGKPGRLWAGVCVALLSSLYLEYSLLSAVIACWLLLYLTGLLRVDRPHLFLYLGSMAAGIGLHLMQNMLYLGPQTFCRELALTLCNRLTGTPTQQELSAFYRALGLVHHGSHAPRLAFLWTVVLENFKLPIAGAGRWFGSLAVLGLLLCLRFRAGGPGSATVRLARGGRRALGFFLRLGLWIAGTILAPILLFPAFAQEVNLRGAGGNHFFLAIGMYALAAFALRQVLARSPVRFRFLGTGAGVTARLRHSFRLARALARAKRAGVAGSLAAAAGGAFVLLLAALGAAQTVGAAKGVFAARKAELDGIRSRWQQDPYADLEDLKRFAGELYVTNINTPTVGFFTQSAGYGVCGLRAVTEDGRIDRSQCKVAFMRRADLYDREEPRYFFYFWSPDLFPGFADEMPTHTLIGGDRGGDARIQLMQERLEAHFTKVFENRLFRVYDLRRRKERPALWVDAGRRAPGGAAVACEPAVNAFPRVP